MTSGTTNPAGAASSRPRALLISPAFFGYEKDITQALDRQGLDTTYLDERPSNSSLVRAVLRVRRSLIDGRVERFYRRQAAEHAGQDYALIVVIKAEVVPRWFLEDLRRTNPDARLVFYTFDSLGNASNCLSVLDLFDERLTFDRSDAAERDDFDYLPLFYAPEFDLSRDADAGVDPPHDVSFVGTLHSDRFRFVKKALGHRLDAYIFFYVQARWYFALQKYVTRAAAHVRWSDVRFTPLSRGAIARIFKDSHAVLDMQRDGQTGLTMRTFEVLASGAVLVTTNSAVAQEPFYDPERIVVVDAADLADDARLATKLDAAVARPKALLPGFERYGIDAFAGRLASVVTEPGTGG